LLLLTGIVVLDDPIGSQAIETTNALWNAVSVRRKVKAGAVNDEYEWVFGRLSFRGHHRIKGD
jgi:hypothetical protein